MRPPQVEYRAVFDARIRFLTGVASPHNGYGSR
jgi:hypothetical protein